MPPRTRGVVIDGNLNIKLLLGFAFGVIFLIAILVIVIMFPNPTQTQLDVFVTVLALSAAGVAGLLAGELVVNMNANVGPLGVIGVRAGGAIAVFVLIFFYRQPLERVVADLKRPDSDPQVAAQSYLKLADVGKYEEGWQQWDQEMQASISANRPAFKSIMETVQNSLGPVVARKQVGLHEGKNLIPGAVGYYAYLTYNTKFSKSPECRGEVVVLRASQDLQWRVYSHQITPEDIPCIS